MKRAGPPRQKEKPPPQRSGFKEQTQPARLRALSHCQQRWNVEAERLLAEFQRTGDTKHLRAYERHAEAMIKATWGAEFINGGKSERGAWR